MQNVAVPRDYFVKTARRDYEDPSCALIREFLQNSRDAGATEIRFNISEPGPGLIALTCADNGKGMDENIISNKLMALGATDKGDDSTGGFGVAKILLFFAHTSYTIRTRDLKVSGGGGSYKIENGQEYVNGVTATVLLSNDVISGDAYALMSKATNEVRKSYLPTIKVYVNGQQVDALTKAGRKVEELGNGITVHKTRSDKVEYYAAVRVRGLHMFNTYMGESKFKVCVELDGYSTELLTTNRDNFRGEWRSKVERFVQSMALNTAATNKSSVAFYRGEYSRVAEGAAALVRKINEAVQSAFASAEPSADHGALVQAEVQAALAETGDPELIEAVTKITNQKINNGVGNTFQITVADLSLTHHYFVETIGNFRKVPKSWEPHNFKPSQVRLLELWAQIVSMTLKDAGSPDTTFNVGFVLDDGSIGETCAAKYRGRTDGPVFLLNPLLYGDEGKLPAGGKRRQELILWLMELAAHEVTHFKGYDLHNESFIMACGEIRRKMNTRFQAYLKLAKKGA